MIPLGRFKLLVPMQSIKPPNLPRELNLLLAYCRASMDQDVGRRVRTLTSGPINGEAFDAAVELDALKSSRRNKNIIRARAIISFLAVDHLKISASEVSGNLNMTVMGVGKCVERAKKTLLCREMQSLFNWYDRQQLIRGYIP